jgi:hypothetical protein
MTTRRKECGTIYAHGCTSGTIRGTHNMTDMTEEREVGEWYRGKGTGDRGRNGRRRDMNAPEELWWELGGGGARCESVSLVCCWASMVVTKLWIQHNLF